MDDYYDFDPDINIDYGKSPQGNEVLIINSREIFRLKKTGKRTLHGNFTLSWCCNNTSNCSATVTSSRVDVDLEGSDCTTSLQSIDHFCLFLYKQYTSSKCTFLLLSFWSSN